MPSPTATAPPDVRRKALELVLEGAALRDVAQVLELPLWLRRLPPEAFSGSIRPLPSSELFARRIVNQLPTAAEDSALLAQIGDVRLLCVR